MDARIEFGGSPATPALEERLRCAIEFDTAATPPSERFEAFQSWHSTLINVCLEDGDPNTFEAGERIWQLGDIVFVAIDASPSHLLHWEHKKKPVVDNWIVFVKEIAGPHAVGSSMGPRLRVANLAAPSTCETKGKLIALFLPYNAIEAPFQPEIADGTARFFADYITLLHANLPYLQRDSGFRVAEATTQMLAAVIAPSQEGFVQAQAPIDAVITSRAIRAIELNLTDPGLGPEFLCKNVGVSRSRLYRIFEPAGGISNYIRRKRLLETCRALADDTSAHSVSHIAEQFGFVDPSSFSRMFKREFGLSPKEIRALGWQEIQHSATISDETDGNTPTLDALLISNSLHLPFRAAQKYVRAASSLGKPVEEMDVRDRFGTDCIYSNMVT